MRRAIELDPNSANAHYLYAFGLLVPEKKFDQALEEFRTALALDPLSPIMNTNYAATLMDAHRYPEALAQFQKTVERDPTFRPAHHKLAHLYAATGDFANAVNELKSLLLHLDRGAGTRKAFMIWRSRPSTSRTR
jgi:Tfp pilus assembly protein PilF